MLGNMVETELLMDMSDRSGKSRMETLLISYLSILRRNGINWSVDGNPKLAVQHVESAAKHKFLCTRLEFDLGVKVNYLWKDFNFFMKLAFELPVAHKTLDSGSENLRPGKSNNRNGRHTHGTRPF